MKNRPRKPNSLHVVQAGRGWRAVKGGAKTNTGTVYRTQRQAIMAGRAVSRKLGAELCIHGRDGKIRQKNSYGRDPFPPRG